MEPEVLELMGPGLGGAGGGPPPKVVGGPRTWMQPGTWRSGVDGSGLHDALELASLEGPYTPPKKSCAGGIGIGIYDFFNL